MANAGITRDTLLLRMSEEDFDAVLDTNLVGAFRVAKRASRTMLRARFGRLIFISSVVGLTGSAGQANYAASKAGLVGFARSLARELGSRGITANVVAPGFVDTEMTQELPEERRAEILGQVPLGRYAVAGGGRVPWWPSSPATPPATSRGRSSRSTADSAWGTELLTANDSGGRTRMGLLEGKRLLITGVLTDASIAFTVAQLAQEQGATSCSPASAGCRSCSASPSGCPTPPPVIELDVTTTPEHLAALPERVREHVDGTRRRAARDRLRARGRARRQLPATPSGTTSPPRCTSRRSRSSRSRWPCCR